MFPPSLLYFGGGYVETSFGGKAGQALSEIEGACQKVRRRKRQHQPAYENNRYNTSLIQVIPKKTQIVAQKGADLSKLTRGQRIYFLFDHINILACVYFSRYY